MVAIPNPSKPIADRKSYRPISLLDIPYKILERFIYARVEPIIEPLLLRKQVGFRRGKSTVDQVILLTQGIENNFSAKQKASWPHLQASASTAGQAHDLNDRGTCP